jgi:tight adherence protein C
MGFAGFTFLFIFLLIASGGLILFYREAMIERISSVITPRPKQGSLRETIEQTGATLGSMVERF